MVEAGRENNYIVLFTIGFAGKKAKEFFRLLQENDVKKIIDIRFNNKSQLAGFTKDGDLEFFLDIIAGIKYEYRPELAPDKQLLKDYQNKKINWNEYEKRFLSLLNKRQVEKTIKSYELAESCLLCSEPTAVKCHRRLVAEYFQSLWPNIIIKHL